MDYVVRQFFNLTKKLREDLREALKKQTDAITDATKAERENKQNPLPVPLPVIAELQTTETEKRERRTEYRRGYRLQVWLTVGTWLAFIAAAIYARITAVTLEEIKRQTPYFAQSANAADTSAKNQTKAFNSEQRAWVVPIYTGPDQAHPVVANAPLAHFFNIVNTGKTPAVHVEVVAVIDLYRFDEVLPLGLGNYSHESGLGTDRRSYSILWPQMLKPDTFQSHKNKYPSRGYFIEDTTYKLYTQNQLFVALFGQITYDDIQGHSHWVHFCGTDEFAQPVYLTAHDPRRKCLEYNAVDSDPE